MNTDEPIKRSTFVTVIAWILIVITGFSTFVTAIQNIMIQIMFNDSIKEQMLASDPEAIEQMPAFFSFMFANFDVMFLIFFILNLVAFIASIGLLLRKNWGRIIIIGLMALGIVWNIGGLYMQHAMVTDMETFQAEMFEDQQQNSEEQQNNSNQQDEEECCESDPCCDKDHEGQEDSEERKKQFEEFQKNMESMQNIIFWMGLLMAIVFTLIEGFIIWKLCTPKIVAEFKTDK